MDEKHRAGRMKKRLLIAALVLAVLVVVAIVVPVGAVTLDLDQETYRRSETVTLTTRSLCTGVVMHGYYFEVQRFEDGDWVRVPLDVFFKSVDLVLLPGQSYEQSFVPAEYFVETPETGRYRVVKEYGVGTIHYGAGRETLTLIAEFRIEDPIS